MLFEVHLSFARMPNFDVAYDCGHMPQLLSKFMTHCCCIQSHVFGESLLETQEPHLTPA